MGVMIRTIREWDRDQERRALAMACELRERADVEADVAHAHADGVATVKVVVPAEQAERAAEAAREIEELAVFGRPGMSRGYVNAERIGRELAQQGLDAEFGTFPKLAEVVIERQVAEIADRIRDAAERRTRLLRRLERRREPAKASHRDLCRETAAENERARRERDAAGAVR